MTAATKASGLHTESEHNMANKTRSHRHFHPYTFTQPNWNGQFFYWDSNNDLNISLRKWVFFSTLRSVATLFRVTVMSYEKERLKSANLWDGIVNKCLRLIFTLWISVRYLILWDRYVGLLEIYIVWYKHEDCNLNLLRMLSHLNSASLWETWSNFLILKTNLRQEFWSLCILVRVSTSSDLLKTGEQ